jgi:ABC-2 type transport system permease protein
VNATRVIMARHLAEERWSILIWWVVVVALSFLIVGVYSTMETLFDFAEMYERMPRFIKDMTLGNRPLAMDPLNAFLAMKFFSFQAWGLGFFTCLFAGGICAKEMERKTLEGLLALPVRRRSVIAGKLLAYLLALVVILLSMYGAFCAALLVFVESEVYFVRYAYTFVNCFFLLLAIAGYAFLLSCLIDDQRRVIVISVGIMLIMFVADLMLDLSDTLKPWQALSLFAYFRTGGAIETGRFPWDDVGVLAGFAVVTLAATVFAFRRKEISG